MTHEFMTGDGMFRLSMFMPEFMSDFMNKWVGTLTCAD